MLEAVTKAGDRAAYTTMSGRTGSSQEVWVLHTW